MKLTCFKAYDIRGRLGDELNNEIAYRIGRAYGHYLQPDNVVVGGDVRLTSETLKNSLASGLRDAGVDVIDIGLAGTEEIYFATSHLQTGGGIIVTASHNPMDYNGMKLVREGSRPISGDSGLRDIEALAEANDFPMIERRGSLKSADILPAYVEHLLSYITLEKIKPLKLVINSGNGAAGHVIDVLDDQFRASGVPLEVVKVNNDPDGHFPNGIPNPLLIDNRQDTIDAVLKHKADLGIAFDGDFDRCFFFDHTGAFIEGYYIVGLLAEAFLQKRQGSTIIHDPRLVWNTIEIAELNGGTAIQSKTGHAFIKERMRKEDAVYGGEMSAHHYFKDFFYCDSGMIPWLLVAELISAKNLSLNELISERMIAYPSSGEINFVLKNPKGALEEVERVYRPDALTLDKTDGISLEFKNWRLNLRSSNTEPVVRLNIEARSKPALVTEKVAEIEALLRKFS